MARPRKRTNEEIQRDSLKEWNDWLQYVYYQQKMGRDIQYLLDNAYWYWLGRMP